MAKKSKEKWEPMDGKLVWEASIRNGKEYARRIQYSFVWRYERSAGLIYRTKRESIAYARRMLAAAKQG